jgi:hypothetical protein
MAQSFVVMGSQLLAPLRAVLGANGVRYSIPVVGIGSESSVAQRQPDTSTLRGRLVNLRQQCAASLGGLYDPVVLSHCSPATATTRAVFTATSGSRRPMFNINNLWTWCARSCLHLPDSSPASSGRQRGTPRRPRLASRVTDKAPGEKDCPGLLLGQTGLSGQGRVMVVDWRRTADDHAITCTPPTSRSSEDHPDSNLPHVAGPPPLPPRRPALQGAPQSSHRVHHSDRTDPGLHPGDHCTNRHRPRAQQAAHVKLESDARPRSWSNDRPGCSSSLES